MGIKYFEDVVDGEQLHCRQVLMTRASIIEFAKQFDPQPFHIDECAANDSIFKGLVASSLRTLSACTRVVVEAQGEIAILSGAGIHKLISIAHSPSLQGTVGASPGPCLLNLLEWNRSYVFT